MLARLIRTLRRLRAERRRNRAYRLVPCRLCGFLAEVTASRNHGGHCVYYDVYVPKAAVDDHHSEIRLTCREDGENFRFRMRGISPIQLLEWKMRHSDWHLSRRAAQIGATVGVLSLALGAIGIWVR